ncbi:dTDP-glucose 4,6-dehydratase [bacterium]|nr:dTDP-glucose 4,6-dehydratase [bacterium]
MNILVTGGVGFIGSNFIRMIVKNYSQYNIINVDKLTYAGNLENLKNIEHSNRYKFYKTDICDIDELEKIFKNNDIDHIINFAAESHVDRSILTPEIFIDTNVKGTMNLLEMAKKYKVNKYLQVSTDEVYGTLGKKGKFTESTNLSPNSPYSASKASADLLCRSYNKTFDLPIIITRCSNNYGPYQFPEKLIPLMIYNTMNDKELPVYGDGKNIRDWIYVEDHCLGILTALEKGTSGSIYNIGGNSEKENIEIVELILKGLNKPKSLIKYVKDRPGHDRRYAIDATKIKNELGWEPKITFEDGMKKTIKWYIDNTEWTKRCINGDYLKYYEQNYKSKE